jgi:signal transduction histidine kinase
MNRVHDPVTLTYHELRAPLGLIVTAARAAADECSDVAVRGRCEVIVRTAERMLRDAQELFRVFRAGATEPETFLPDRLILSVFADLQELGVPLDIAWPETFEARATGQPAVLESLVHCLASNACDHLAEGGRIKVAVAGERHWLVLRLSNPRDPVGRHRGIGAGRLIEQRLADELGARVTHEADGAEHVAELRLPVTFV